MSTISQERIYQVLLAPHISEKSTFVAERNNQVVFRVASDATKPEIKAAVEALFKVDVESVQVVNVKGKQKRFGRFIGRCSDVRKAYVGIKAGQDLDLTMGA
jgi:large subunit ribosomal protein L23